MNVEVHQGFRSLFGGRSQPGLRDLLALPEGSWIVLNFWQLPSFTDAFLWTIFYDSGYRPHENAPNVKKFQWQNWYPDYRFDKGMCTRQTTLDRDVYNNLISKGEQIKIPLVNVSIPFGNDGVVNGFEMLGVGSTGYRLSWWARHPSEWQPIVEWYWEMVNFLKESLDQLGE